jgi:hypothetical protein
MEKPQPQQEQPALTILARTRLTEQQVQTAIAEFLLKDDELKNTLVGKGVRVISQWQTSKWSDPDALVHVIFVEAPGDVMDENGDDDSGDVSGVVLEGSPFTVNSPNSDT